jgi:hypothetical protein
MKELEELEQSQGLIVNGLQRAFDSQKCGAELPGASRRGRTSSGCQCGGSFQPAENLTRDTKYFRLCVVAIQNNGLRRAR